jgi:hypothetical protein
MFCGESYAFDSEEEAVKHMEDCESLRKQVDSKEPYTIPNFDHGEKK